jgi:NAD(P)-dependent dehydrogenase (short-subunit alcohol dehydrogenase family)
MTTFEKKTVLITGGTSGIGKATALAFAKEGAKVVVAGLHVAEGEQVAREITSAGGRALFVQTDVIREDDITALIEKTVATFGELHIAFNNAGVEGRFGLLTTEQTVEHYHQICDVNIRGVLLSMKYEIPAILRSGGGAIVNTSSTGGHIGLPGLSVYVASKFAVIGLTKTAALEFAKQGVRINSVSPGPTQTEMFDRAFGKRGDRYKESDRVANPDRPLRDAGRDRQRRALAHFARSSLHFRPRHHRRRWIHRTIARLRVGESPSPTGLEVTET